MVHAKYWKNNINFIILFKLSDKNPLDSGVKETLKNFFLFKEISFGL